MLYSMTGFGRGEAPCGAGAAAVEVSTVNNRYLEVTVRGLREYGALELRVRARVAERLARGSVNVNAALQTAGGGNRKVAANVELAREYERAFDQLRAALGLKGSLPLEALTNHAELLTFEEAGADAEALGEAVLAALDRALDKVVATRETEGAKLGADVTARAERLRGIYAALAARAPAVVAAYREKLRGRVAEFAAGAPVDENRLAAEVSYFAERADITEEVVRSQTHLQALAAALAEGGRVGRRLDFLIVELNREANTVAAKAQDAAAAAAVIEIKDLLEQIREQVQNLE